MLNRVSWGAVLAGVVVALVAQLILNMLGVGVGAATLNPTGGAGDNPSAQNFSIGAGIWWTLAEESGSEETPRWNVVETRPRDLRSAAD
jgi:hypothetical protein